MELAEHKARTIAWRPSKEEEIALVARAQAGDKPAMDLLLKGLYGLVVHFVSRVRRQSVEVDDLVSEGLLGAKRAVELFDPVRGARLSTYAGTWIRSTIQRFIHLDKVVHIPVRRLEGDPQTRYELRVFSLDAPTHNNADDGSQERSGYDILAPTDDAAADDRLVEANEGATVRRCFEVALQTLSPRNREMMQARFFGDGGDGDTLEGVASTFGLTRERVRQIESVFKARLKSALAADGVTQPASSRDAREDQRQSVPVAPQERQALRRGPQQDVRSMVKRPPTADVRLDVRQRAAQWAAAARARGVPRSTVPVAAIERRCLQCRRMRPIAQMTRSGAVRVHCNECVVRRRRVYNPAHTLEDRIAAIRHESGRAAEPRPSDDGPHVLFTQRSRNKKLGPIPTSMSERGTCPASCSFYDVGCYASYAWSGDTWRKTRATGLPWRDFLEEVRALPEGTLWRHNEAGDLAGDAEGTTLDSEALDDLVDANAGRHGFTYTHRTRPLLAGDEAASTEIADANSAGFTVNLSADSLEEADALFDLYIAPVVVTLPTDAPRSGLTSPAGRPVVICPAQTTKGITCASCQLCSKAERKTIVGFLAHGGAARLVSELVRSKRARPDAADAA